MSIVVDMSGTALDPELEFHIRTFLEGREDHPGEALESVIELTAYDIGERHLSGEYAELRELASKLIARLDQMKAL